MEIIMVNHINQVNHGSGSFFPVNEVLKPNLAGYFAVAGA